MIHVARAAAMFALAVSLLGGCSMYVQFPSMASRSPRITASLFRPDAPGRRPAVVLLHPCGGVEPFLDDWARWLSSEGYVALVVDSFTARGVRNLCEAGHNPTMGEVAGDALGALRYLRTLPFVDAQRAAVMGWSSGGGAVLYLSRASSTSWLGGGQEGFQAAVAFYPPCEGALADINIPLLMLLAGRDDWTPIRSCVELGEVFKGETLSVRSIVYAAASHGFDQPRPPRTYLGHYMAYDASATSDAQQQVRRFLAESFR